ncbi:MAG: ATP phosphoribosyltransferase regulatory subunit [bacterium]
MTEHLSRIPSGMRYYVGEEARLRGAVENCAMSVFDGWSYEEVITPSVDYYALFEQGMGAEAHRAFRFTDSDGRMLALRPDITSSVARAAATLLADHPRPLRLCYAGPVFRQQRVSHVEWLRETTQLGCELIGVGGGIADLEVLLIATEILERLGLRGSSCITINNVEVLNGVAENLELDEEARERMRGLIDIRDTAELERFLVGYKTTPQERQVFSRLTQLAGKGEILNKARSVITNERSVAALDALKALWDAIESLGLQELFEIDLGDASGLDYYTGLVFKVFVHGLGARVGRGGRYDRLIADFGRPEPAIGFILDLDGLTEILRQRELGSLLFETPNPEPIKFAAASEMFREAKAKRANGKRIQIKLGEIKNHD